MAGKNEYTQMRKVLDQSRICADEDAVQNLMDTITSMCNSFTIEAGGIVNLSTGQVAPPDVQKDLKEAEEAGQLAHQCFIQERVTGDEKDIYSPLKMLKLKTFSDINNKIGNKNKTENIALKASTDLLGRMVVIGKIHNVDMKDALCYSLHPYPPSLSTHDGTLAKTNKAILRNELERISPVESLQNPPRPGSNIAWIQDGMALLQELKYISAAFGGLATEIFGKIVSIANKYGVKRFDFVPDRYP